MNRSYYRKRSFTIISVLFLLVITSVAVLLFGNAFRAVERSLYPIRFSEIVDKYSEQYDVPKHLIYAVIRTESSFSETATSHANAYGLMQITEDTFYWLESKSGEEYPLSMLYDKEINIKYGVFFLSILYEKFGCWSTVCAAYNAGMNRVSDWLEDKSYSTDGVTLYNIPIEETKNYIVKVKNALDMYEKLYCTSACVEWK